MFLPYNLKYSSLAKDSMAGHLSRKIKISCSFQSIASLVLVLLCLKLGIFDLFSCCGSCWRCCCRPLVFFVVLFGFGLLLQLKHFFIFSIHGSKIPSFQKSPYSTIHPLSPNPTQNPHFSYEENIYLLKNFTAS